VKKKKISHKSTKREGRGRMPGGSTLAPSKFLDSAFSMVESLTSSSTTARRKMRLDLQWHFCEIVALLNQLASQKKNTLAARWATMQLCELALTCTDHLREIAIRDERQAEQRRCAGGVLGWIYVGLEKHDALLAVKNSAYRRRRRTLRKQRKDVIVARDIIGKTIQEELARAEQYRAHLRVIQKLVRNEWQDWARKCVPKEYWVTLKLPPFSVKAVPEWFEKIIWPQIKRRGRKLLRKLQGRSRRAQQFGVKAGKVYLKDYYSQFRNRLLALARLRVAGPL
jgi:hypothetical protein